MKKQIDLTIIIPVYNVEKFVLKALWSIKNQNPSKINYEVLIIDDGSKDNSAHLINDWIGKNTNQSNLNQGCFKYFKKQNGNWGSVINFAKDYQLINGKYVTILDADDYFESNCFEKIEKYIIEEKYELIFSNFYRKNKNKLFSTNVMLFKRTGELKQNRSFVPWSIPLCKFFQTKKFLQMESLKEGVSYQDQILFHTFVSKSKKIFYMRDKLGTYYENREGSSTSLLWDEKRISVWNQNMNKLLSLKNKNLAAYVIMMLNYAKNNAQKDMKKKIFIDKKYIFLVKKAKFSWFPFFTRNLSKIVYLILISSIIRNSKKLYIQSN